ncbi:hypothetical protein PMIN01_00682 [Paraphaeosphaeria minitans]|uniref:Uncharacterized protein n=1 Tax=Paraphaeosphaeria minitans TaxID=565426 RepID=A0A9P6KVN2_9PLEO|nr:hypothetical protein PMIN01_00682 [Paraphaeosphaeria minitans]
MHRRPPQASLKSRCTYCQLKVSYHR